MLGRIFRIVLLGIVFIVLLRRLLGHNHHSMREWFEIIAQALIISSGVWILLYAFSGRLHF